MSNEKILVITLRRLAELVAAEAKRNPDFSAKLDNILRELPISKRSKVRTTEVGAPSLPDIFAEWKERGDTEFELWLKNQPFGTLKGLIRKHDLDPSQRSQKWTDREKLARLIFDQLKMRSSRGGAFLRE